MDEQNEKTMHSLLLWMKIQTGVVGALLVLLVVGGLYAKVQVDSAGRMLRTIEVERINTILTSLEKTTSEVEKLDAETLMSSVSALRDTAKNLSQVDMDAMNKGIHELSEAAGLLNDLDIAQLNRLIQSLEKTAGQMEKTTSLFGKLFG